MGISSRSKINISIFFSLVVFYIQQRLSIFRRRIQTLFLWNLKILNFEISTTSDSSWKNSQKIEKIKMKCFNSLFRYYLNCKLSIYAHIKDKNFTQIFENMIIWLLLVVHYEKVWFDKLWSSLFSSSWGDDGFGDLTPLEWLIFHKG